LLLELVFLQLHGLLQHGHALAVGVALEAAQLQLADALAQLPLPASMTKSIALRTMCQVRSQTQEQQHVLYKMPPSCSSRMR
jgi:hypothetical protein